MRCFRTWRRCLRLSRETHTHTLRGSHVYGCTFSEGTPETCALHVFLHDDARCTEGI